MIALASAARSGENVTSNCAATTAFKERAVTGIETVVAGYAGAVPTRRDESTAPPSMAAIPAKNANNQHLNPLVSIFVSESTQKYDLSRESADLMEEQYLPRHQRGFPRPCPLALCS